MIILNYSALLRKDPAKFVDHHEENVSFHMYICLHETNASGKFLDT